MDPGSPILLFDGECNLCNGFVQFVIKHDSAGRFRFTSLQSEAGKKLLAPFFAGTSIPDSVVLLEHGKCFTKSEAALRVLKQLQAPWPLLYAFIAVPGFIRNPVYDWVARNRYRWFGRQDSCLLPTPQLRQRFL